MLTGIRPNYTYTANPGLRVQQNRPTQTAKPLSFSGVDTSSLIDAAGGKNFFIGLAVFLGLVNPILLAMRHRHSGTVPREDV